ncbi:unnamed protein product [Cladocopium goreaui]|uniref:Uncharacterized protein YqeW n=1 Tax=Cladocopium goreaui TaxID=2562237 RepID=A0A9P1BES6_9DINO|nr:unnamed protein product [Cladocopium goreaui]
MGGLGLFLLGMKYLSEGMQAVAGASLRRMIVAVTDNRFMATLVGTIVTCVVQSSSITTVMVVGFVNSGVMQLSQAIGVIMGANIGTTVTGWMLVVKVGKYGLPLLGGSAFVYLFAKSERWRYWAMALMGVGMVFFGLELMKDACAIIKDMPDFEAWFQRFQADSYLGVLKCALVGCVMTTLVQSSSATLGITISLAFQGVISYETAAALVLGENIGTTITALLASLGATTNARRAAYFHMIFNLVGVFWITAPFVFFRYIKLIQWLVDGDVSQMEMVDGEETFPHTTAAIAATHSIFNVTNTLLFLPFLPFFVRFLNWAVPGKGFKEKPRLTDLDIRMLETPLLAIEQSRKEIERMGDGCSKMLDWLAELVEQDSPDKTLADRLKHREQVLDAIQDEVAIFITNLLSANVPHSVADEARRQLRMADEYESVSDYVVNLDRFDRKLRRDGYRFTEQQRADLVALNHHMKAYLADVNEALAKKNENIVAKTAPTAKRLREEIKNLRRKHMDDLSDGNIPPMVTVAYMAALNAFSRVRDHTHNIAEAISGPYSEIVAFDSSLTDQGNLQKFLLDGYGFIFPPPPYFEGRVTNGKVYVEYLAEQLGLPAPEASLKGGKNYSFAGALAGPGMVAAEMYPPGWPNVGEEVDQYLSDYTPVGDELFVISGGQNNLYEAEFQEGGADVGVLVDLMLDHVTTLANAGANNFLVTLLAPLEKLPESLGDPVEGNYYGQKAAEFNALLVSELDALEDSLLIDISILDLHSLYNDIIASPQDYGMVNVTDPAYNGESVVPNPDDTGSGAFDSRFGSIGSR